MEWKNIVYTVLLLVRFSSAAYIRDESTTYSTSPVSDESTSIGDCTVDNNTYTNGDKVPSLGPCEECHCQDSEVVCSMIKCKPNNSGCKIIQQTNHCCPQYKCECEFNGRMYNNGERLERPDDPCWVCYCKGGEVMCTSITCYERNDCTPHFVPGQCCPKYDHCPIEIHHSSGNNGGHGNSSNFNGKREMQPWLLTVAVTNQTSSLVTPTTNMEKPSPVNKYPQTIKIIEILPTQGPIYVQQNRVGVSPILLENNNSNNVQLVSTELVKDSSPSSSETDNVVSEVFSVDDGKLDSTTQIIFSPPSIIPTLTSSQEEISVEEDKEKSTEYLNDNEGIGNTEKVTNEESLIKLDASTTVASNDEDNTMASVKINPEEDDELTTEASEQTIFLSKDIDQLSLHSNEDNGNVNLYVPFVRSVVPQNDQNSGSNEELPLFVNSVPSASISNVVPGIDDLIESTTVQDDLITPSSSNEKILLTSQETGNSGDTSKNILFGNNNVSPTEFITVPEYIQSGQFKEHVNKKFDQSLKPELNINNFNVLTTNNEDLIIINDEINNENISIIEVQPDSESYTTMIPHKFAQNLNEVNTESNFIDSTEGSGYEVISGWTYEDSTGETTNQEQTVQPTSSSSSTSSSEEGEPTEANYDNSSHLPPTSLLFTTEGMDDINSNNPMMNTSGIIPNELDQNIITKHSTESTTEKNDSSENTAILSEEDLNNFKENLQKSTTMSFPSILKLNDQIKFLKIEGNEQNQQNETKESTPIAKIGIYNPKKPNDMANLVTVISENNENLSQDNQQQLFTENSMENSRENYTPPHILLTPNDLKTLAEILIHEKIIPPYYQNDERSTNSLEQRSINNEFSTSESQNNEERLETENNTESVEESESAEDEESINNTTDINNLVELINVTNTNQEFAENMTTTQKNPGNLTDKEIWAQNVLDKVHENILVPLQGIELVDRDNTTNTVINESSSTEEMENEEGTTSISPTAQVVREDLFEISNETDGIMNNNNNELEFTTTTLENLLNDGTVVDSEENQTAESSEETTEKGETNKYVHDESSEEDEEESSQSRQIRLQHKDRLVSHLLSTPLLDDKDLLLLQNFFKKNLNN